MDPLSDQRQAMAAHSLEEVFVGSNPQQERRVRPQPEHALRCPRCDSTNTKFCYYNNYSLSQPRYFCKACRRYWTQGGSLRNVPVGGGCRKNKRSSSSSASSSKRLQDQQSLVSNSSNPLIHNLPSIPYDPNDLTLAFAGLHKQQQPAAMGLDDHGLSIFGNLNIPHHDVMGNHGPTTPTPTPTPPTPPHGLLDALRSGFFDDPNGYNHSFYHGFNGVYPFDIEMASAATSTTTKEEAYRSVGEVDNRGLWGLNWQANGEGNMGIMNSGRNWNGNGNGNSWHGLLNSPLV